MAGFKLKFRCSDERGPDCTYETLINRFFEAGWIDRVVEQKRRRLVFHFTKKGKKRFRAIHRMTQELEGELGRMKQGERSELPEIVEAWFDAMESQGD